MTPTFAHGQLRLYLLALLDESPRHGYELIKALSDRFGGTYQPSPGTIYPRLARLEEEGLVTRQDAGRKAIYQITDAGRAELAERRPELLAVETDIAETLRDRAEYLRLEMSDSMADLRADLTAAAKQAKSRPTDPPVFGVVSDESRAYAEAKAASKVRFKEAEACIDMFRAQVRSDLRVLVIRGDLRAETVESLRQGLADLAEDIRSAMH